MKNGGGNSQVNIAFCGCGMIALEHFKHLPGFGARIVACWNAPGHLDSARHLAETAGAKYYTDDLERIAADPEIDAAYVCTWHHDRMPLLTALAKAGKALFVEKPLALHEEEFEQLAELLRRYPVHFHAGFKNRFNSGLVLARQLMPQPEAIFTHVLDFAWPDGSRGAHPDIGGGHILSQGTYGFEAAMLAANARPAEISAFGRVTEKPDAIHGSIVCSCRFANGAVANIFISDSGLAASNISKFFVEMVADGNFLSITNRYSNIYYRTADGTEEETKLIEDGFRLQSKVFLDDLRERRPSSCTFIDGVAPSLMAFRALDSMRNGGRTETIDLKKFIL